MDKRRRRFASNALFRLAVASCALVVIPTGCSRSSATSAAPVHKPPASVAESGGSPTYTLMQMNLCLSGIGDCYAKVAYPAGVNEAAALIRRDRPDAVTLSEACGGDAARIARLDGYHLRFSRVLYRREPFPCIQPGDRGLFGVAVLTRAAVVSTVDHAFTVQTGIEQRRWLCVTTRIAVDVCTAHLSTRSPAEVAGNEAQCAELAPVLSRLPAADAVIFGGDVNRRSSCAPAGYWTRTDASAQQSPGGQQVYGSGALRSPSAEVLPFTHSDHDVLLVRARLVR